MAAFDIDIGQDLFQPCGHPPGRFAQQGHGCWYEQHPHEERVDENPETETELERTVAELMSRAAVKGAIRAEVIVGAVMIVLHGIASAHDRPLWVPESRAAVELLLAGLKAA